MKMVQIPEWAAKLAAEFLQNLSERQSNDGCNDYNLPAYVDRAVLLAEMCKQADADEVNDGLPGYNWAVASCLAEMMERAK